MIHLEKVCGGDVAWVHPGSDSENMPGDFELHVFVIFNFSVVSVRKQQRKNWLSSEICGGLVIQVHQTAQNSPGNDSKDICRDCKLSSFTWLNKNALPLRKQCSKNQLSASTCSVCDPMRSNSINDAEQLRSRFYKHLSLLELPSFTLINITEQSFRRQHCGHQWLL